MGILNVTPDSFFDGGNFNTIEKALKQSENMIKAGVDIIDVGGMSTRPGANIINIDEELQRVIPVIDSLRKTFPQMPLSIDTVHGKVAYEAIQHGAAMINDVSAGSIDGSILSTAAQCKVPYVLMHMQGKPENMQQSPEYDDVVKDVFKFFLDKCQQLNASGVNEILIDPGFGFGKTLEHNYQLAAQLEVFQQIGFPVVVGVSRKSMICKLLKVNSEKALNGTTALHAILLLKGANILRVHDVKEAVEVIKIVEQLIINLSSI